MTPNDIRAIRRKLTAAGYTKADISTGIAYAKGPKGGPGASGRNDGLEMALDRILFYSPQSAAERRHALASH